MLLAIHPTFAISAARAANMKVHRELGRIPDSQV